MGDWKRKSREWDAWCGWEWTKSGGITSSATHKSFGNTTPPHTTRSSCESDEQTEKYPSFQTTHTFYYFFLPLTITILHTISNALSHDSLSNLLPSFFFHYKIRLIAFSVYMPFEYGRKDQKETYWIIIFKNNFLLFKTKKGKHV